MSRLCVILFGPPGSGKGTQAKFLKQALAMAHISTGDMLREHIAAGDALGREVAAVIQAGGLVPDETVNRMVEERIELPDCRTGFILDGFPRTVNQAKLLVGLLASHQVQQVTVHLKVDYNVIIARIAGRRQCPTCGVLYSVTSSAPTVSEMCDYDGSRLLIRDDDREEVVRERLRAYGEQTAPVLDFLRSAGYKVWDVEGADAPPAAIAKRIEGLIRGLMPGDAGQPG